MARSFPKTNRLGGEQVNGDDNRRLFSALYEELCSLAAQRLAQDRSGHTMEVQALVHELFLRFAQRKGLRWENQRHFLATSSKAMRQILIERVRRLRCLRRGGDQQFLGLDGMDIVDDPSEPDLLLRINEALDKLAAVDALKADLVKLRFFGGLTEAEVGRSLGLAERTVRWHWAFAKAWLREEIARPH